MTEIEARINDLVSNFINEITRLARSSALETLERALAGAGGTVVKDVRVAKNYTSIVGQDRTLKTDKGMTSQAKAHFVVADESLLLSVGSSFIYMDKDLIHVSSPLIKIEEKDPRRNHRDSGGIWATGANYSGGAKLPLPEEGK